MLAESGHDRSSRRKFLTDLPFAAVERTLEAAGVRSVHASALWRAVYRKGLTLEAAAAEMSPPMQRWLAERGSELRLDRPNVDALTESADGLTKKFLLKLEDGETVETVLMAYPGRQTACVSTQAGCAMGCVFCATGQMGFSRHLRPGEIVAQVQRAKMHSAGGELRNLVLMGMGEPLHNYDAVMTALEIIRDTRGLNIGPKRITISTVGVAPAIRRLADEGQPYHLAVSLHAANEVDRAKLVPAARRWPLSELIAACRHFCDHTGRKIFFEWTLIAGKNDSADHAHEIVQLLAGLHAHVNLIPLNPTEGYDGAAPAGSGAIAFQQVLSAAGIPSTVRQRRGIDVAAGCGQLRETRATKHTAESRR